MTSKQPVQTNSSAVAAVIPISPAIKDSPAVERALSRSKLYLLVSWSLLYPEDDEFLDYVQCGEFVEDGRAAIDALDTALDGIGGELAKQKLVLLRRHLCRHGREWPSCRHANRPITPETSAVRRGSASAATARIRSSDAGCNVSGRH